jgi:hypothetical protein
MRTPHKAFMMIMHKFQHVFQVIFLISQVGDDLISQTGDTLISQQSDY